MISEINRLGGTFSLRVEPFSEGDFVATQLCDPRSNEAEKMVSTHAAVRGLPVNRYAGSLVFQRYCHRVCSAVVASLVLHNQVLDVSMANSAMRFRDGSPDSLILKQLRVAPFIQMEDVVDVAVEQHLQPLAKVISLATGPAMPNLWGNMAAGFAGAFRKLSLMARTPDEFARVQQIAERLAQTHPKLARGGRYCIVTDGERRQLQYERASCCHWYAAKDGQYCSWCSKISPQERHEKFRQLLQEQSGC